MTIRELLIRYGFEIDRNSQSNAEQGINKLKSFAATALGAIGIGFSIAGLGALAEAAGEAEALESQFTQVFGDMEGQASEALQKIAEDTDILEGRMMGSFSKIAAFAKTTGMDTGQALELSERSMVAVADSAAYYDRSMEEVTESLQSFLKGSFEQDTALGLSCTEVTRNAAANELYSKSFNDLDEAQKQLTLLKMVEDANAASGAMGQAARESDTWTNQLGNLQQHVKDLKAAVGSMFLKPAVMVLKELSALLEPVVKKMQEFSEEINGASEDESILVRKTKEARDVIVSVLGWIEKGIKFVNGMAQAMGGWDKVLKVLIIAAGIFAGALNFNKITGAIKLITKLLNPAYLKIMAIVAVVLILAAVIEDFINFMQGNDSVIGELFKRAGIDAEAARTTIINTWNKIKTTLVSIWNALKQIAVMVFNGLKAFWDRWGDTILQFFADLWVTLGSLIQPFLDILNGLCTFLEGVFTGNWEQIWEGLKMIFQGFVDFIVNLVLGIINALINLGAAIFGPMLAKMKEGFQAVIEWFRSLPDMAKQWMSDFVNGLINGIKEKIGGFVDTIKGIGTTIKEYLHFSVPDKGPLTDYESWMPDFMQGMADGIRDNIPLIRAAVMDASSAMAMMGNASAQTAFPVSGGTTNSRVVNQKNEYNINVTGTDNRAVNNAANTIRQTAGDNTGKLARALAYAR